MHKLLGIFKLPVELCIPLSFLVLRLTWMAKASSHMLHTGVPLPKSPVDQMQIVILVPVESLRGPLLTAVLCYQNGCVAALRL